MYRSDKGSICSVRLGTLVYHVQQIVDSSGSGQQQRAAAEAEDSSGSSERKIRSMIEEDFIRYVCGIAVAESVNDGGSKRKHWQHRQWEKTHVRVWSRGHVQLLR
ncbi:hypothetical protein B296_00057133 [Ensete ventricosum]|uniref:Uncharacterized protein n=1 Tax=Ensete ventricosum TaxID=4639 RepID=A0A426XSL7_ENSVE|nr:hypothetical protein B296_00057133 [Ensete ventricosum]